MLPDFKTGLKAFLTQTINYYHALLSSLPQTLLQHLQIISIYCSHYLATGELRRSPSLFAVSSLAF